MNVQQTPTSAHNNKVALTVYYIANSGTASPIRRGDKNERNV